jgi:hypothetical protein
MRDQKRARQWPESGQTSTAGGVMAKHNQQRENLERMREADRKSEEARARAEEESIVADDRKPEQMSVRARSSGHKKKTADKWNQ